MAIPSTFQLPIDSCQRRVTHDPAVLEIRRSSDLEQLLPRASELMAIANRDAASDRCSESAIALLVAVMEAQTGPRGGNRTLVDSQPKAIAASARFDPASTNAVPAVYVAFWSPGARSAARSGSLFRSTSAVGQEGRLVRSGVRVTKGGLLRG